VSILSQITPAVWSAIAASFSAISAVLMVFIQRRNLLEASRPELVLTGFSRGPSAVVPEFDALGIQQIRNVGKGAALNVVMNSSKNAPDGGMLAGMGTLNIPIIAAGETIDIASEIMLWWHNLPDAQSFVGIPVTIWCWDSREMRHVTDYTLLLASPSLAHIQSNGPAPGILSITRTTNTSPVWLLKFLAQPKWLRQVRANRRMRSDKRNERGTD